MADPETTNVIDHFDAPALDSGIWVPAYLPHWSSREEARATWSIADSVLTLSIPPGHPIWCEEDHHPPIRVSGIQSGSWSGPVGSTRGQQPFLDGLRVREAQPDFEGWTPQQGTIEVRARAEISHRSMFSFWLIGREVDPRECAEICIVEVFGDSRDRDTFAFGAGVHAFRDPDAVENFATTRLPVVVDDWHIYSVRWSEASAAFAIDGDIYREVPSPPQYSMQLEVAVFDFPEWSTGGDDQLVPQLDIDWIRYTPGG